MVTTEQLERDRREKIERLHQEAAEHNSRIVPDHEGYVRTEGPRRQYRAEVRGDEIVYVEI